jgi:hypothetical protein
LVFSGGKCSFFFYLHKPIMALFLIKNRSPCKPIGRMIK